MGIRTISSREFTRDIAGAKRAAAEGPVLITDRGEPSYALLKIEDYYRLAGQAEMSLLELMDSMPDTGGIEFEPPRVEGENPPADLGMSTGDR